MSLRSGASVVRLLRHMTVSSDPPAREAALTPRFPLALDDATYELLRRRAFEERRHMSAIAREALIQHLKRPARRS